MPSILAILVTISIIVGLATINISLQMELERISEASVTAEAERDCGD